ncbi:MAG: OmpH family outer membrane protein [Nitrospirae bacterium]|nr:OmpH family outer membrane protein [Nitrospirota bacterium]MBI3351887.1 OmpH family outer membrane protein [Nitrospirota bacterium]
MKYGVMFLMLIAGIGFGIQETFAADSLKVGYINAIKIFDSTKTGKKSKAILEDYIKSRQKIVDLEEDEIKKLEEELSRQGSVLSNDAKKEKEALFQKKLAQYQKKAMDLNKEIQEKKSEVLHEFNKNLEDIVKKIAEKEGYQVVLDKNPDIGTVVYMASSMDISDKVIEEMDKLNSK